MYLMTFAYDGTNFKGYQKQPKLRTVQGEIEKALKKINDNKKVLITASGRTDSFVHALNQKAHFDLKIKITPLKLKKALNSLLADDIYIKKIDEVKESFHARFNVVRKEYIYKINVGDFNPIERNYIYQHGPLNLMEVERGLKYFEGEHNFRSFVKKSEEKESYVRTIFHTTFTKEDNIITISFVGDGFMRYMVRNMIGLLIEIGEGKRECSSIIEVLNKEDRTFAGITAPACGLYLANVFYE